MKTKTFFIVLIIGLISNVKGQIPSDGLVGYWPFNGNANDESGNLNNGNVLGAQLTSDRFGIQNSAFYFDGASYITCGADNILNIQGGITIAAWIKLDGYPTEEDFGYMSIVNKWRSYILQIHYLYGLTLTIPEGPDYSHWRGIQRNIDPDIDFPFNEWFFVAGTYNDTTNVAELYINGVKMSSGPRSDGAPIDLSINMDTLKLGFESNSAEQYFKGSMDDIRLYSRSLTSNEITSLYNEGKCFETIYDTTFVVIYDTVEVLQYISVTDTLIIDVTITGIISSENINTISIYPNPTKDFIFINTGTKYDQLQYYKIKIIDMTGSVIFESFITEQLFEINLNSFGDIGLFLIQIIDNSDNIIDTRKLLLK